MRRSWLLWAGMSVALGVSAGCRVGYEEIKELGSGEAGGSAATGGSSVGGGTQGGTAAGGTSGTMSEGGEGGDGATGGSDPNGGSSTGGSSTGGSSTGGSSTGGSSTGGSSTGGSSTGGSSTGGSSTGGSSTGGSSTGGTGAGMGGSGAGMGGTSTGGTGGMSGAGGGAGAPDPGVCNSGSFGGHDYLFCREERAWPDANSGCAALGMRLVRIDSAEENQWVFDNAYTDGARFMNVWIGANDLAVDGEWRWTDGDLFWIGGSSGTPQNGLYVVWYFREPNNVSAAEHCATLRAERLAEWYDWQCETPIPFVCESL